MTEHSHAHHSGRKSGAKVKVTRNGPYIVSGGVPLSKQVIVEDANGDSLEWRRDGDYPTQGSVSLCRCGRSAQKPFCDGTHSKVGFDGTETADPTPYMDQAEETVGPALRLTDVEAFCASARFCDRAGGTWNLTKASANPEAKRIAIEEACNCPSGRLVAWEPDGRVIEPEFEPSIGLVEDPEAGVGGPIWVRGGIPVEAADGTEYEMRNRVTLCRCGKSSNKPFCDGSHMDE